MPIALIYIAAGMLVLAAFPMSYGYYDLLRVFATLVFFWAGNVAYNNKERFLPWLFYFLAILFNPIIKIYLTREIWIVIDIASAIILIMFSARIVEDENPKKTKTVTNLGAEEPSKEPRQSSAVNDITKLEAEIYGSNFEFAIPVTSVAQEYEWLETNYPDYERGSQEVHSSQSGLFDVIEIQMKDGSSRKVYFDISGILAQWVSDKKTNSNHNNE